MEILVDNSGYGLDNLGDVAMLQVAVRRLKDIFPRAHIHVITAEPSRLAIYADFTVPVSERYRSAWFDTFNLIGAWRRFFPPGFYGILQSLERKFRISHPELAVRRLAHRFSESDERFKDAAHFFQLVKQADLVVATGGGFVNDVFIRHASMVLDVLSLAKALGKPTAMLGQGLGPIKDPGLLKDSLSALQGLSLLTLREGKFSPDLVPNVLRSNTSRCIVTGDDAIEIAYSEQDHPLGASIGLNVRLHDYSGLGETVASEIGGVVVDFSKQKSAPISILPVCIKGAKNDFVATKAMLPDTGGFVEPQDETVENLVNLVRGCRLVMTASYHAAVFALSQGIPVIALVASDYYAAKFEGLAHQFPGGVVLINLSNSDWKKSMQSALQSAWDSSPSLRPKLRTFAEAQRNLSRLAYQVLKEIV